MSKYNIRILNSLLGGENNTKFTHFIKNVKKYAKIRKNWKKVNIVKHIFWVLHTDDFFFNLAIKVKQV